MFIFSVMNTKNIGFLFLLAGAVLLILFGIGMLLYRCALPGKVQEILIGLGIGILSCAVLSFLVATILLLLASFNVELLSIS